MIVALLKTTKSSAESVPTKNETVSTSPKPKKEETRVPENVPSAKSKRRNLISSVRRSLFDCVFSS